LETDDLETHQRKQNAWMHFQRMQASIGKRYAEAKLSTWIADTPQQQQVLTDVLAWCDNLTANIARGRGVVMIGPKGSGKTHLAVGILKRCAMSLHTVAAIDGQQMYLRMRDAIKTDTTESEIIRAWTAPDVLLIDDPIPVGGDNSAYQLSTLWNVIDRRYRDLKPTIVTLNVANGDEAARRLSPQIVDRLRDGALVLSCNWPSHRQPAEVAS